MGGRRKSRYFNPRIPAGCDAPTRTRWRVAATISILASLRDATKSKYPSGITRTNFNPRIPAGCDPYAATERDLTGSILILASLRDATPPPGPSNSEAPLISIHASLRDATRSRTGLRARRLQFQSTHPCGMRLHLSQYRRRPRYFNPRIPAGCDVCGSKHIIPGIFQSTHPCGMRRSCLCCSQYHSYHFNPRIPAGCDTHKYKLVITYHISIHASLRDATCTLLAKLATKPQISIHASLRDATPASFKTSGLNPLNFNPRIPAGCDYAGRSMIWRPRYFNPRIPAGCDSIA